MNDLNDLLINDLSNLWRLWRKISLAPVKRGEITLEQRWILRYLVHHDSITVGQLASVLGTTPSSITLITKKMEKNYLLKRTRGEPDDRTVTMKITDEGKKRWNEWNERRKKEIFHILASLSKVEQEQLHLLLSRILEKPYEDKGASDDSDK
jgi:DNA-binding MarR family transcriptional regulator